MADYTKFKLKRKEELASALADKDNIFVIACNKCFKELEGFDEPDCGLFEEIAKEQEERAAAAKIDMQNRTEKSKDSPQEPKSVFVISCGLGNTNSLLTDWRKHLFSASDTIAVDGQHGMP